MKPLVNLGLLTECPNCRCQRYGSTSCWLCRPTLTKPFTDIRTVRVDRFIDTAPQDDPEVDRWRRAVRLPVTGEVVRWWDRAQERSSRVEAFERLQPTEARFQYRQLQLGFYRGGDATRERLLGLRDRSENAVHYTRVLDRLQDHMQAKAVGLTEALVGLFGPLRVAPVVVDPRHLVGVA